MKFNPNRNHATIAQTHIATALIAGRRYAPSTRIIPVLWPLIPAKDLVLDENIWLCPSLLFFPSLFREFSY
jgi:hypothetical protein